VLLAPKEALGETFGASGVLGLILAAALLREPQPIAGFALDGTSTRLGASPAAMVSALCYSGNVVAMVVSA
jgi:hypothetical protein